MTRKQVVRELSFFFNVKEFFCPHIVERFGESAWNFPDIRLLETVLWIRKTLAKPMMINSQQLGLTERGMRCNLCNEVKKHDTAYLSAHVLGQGVDFTVTGMTATQVRKWIDDHKDDLPHKIRLERKSNGKEISWVHLDVRNEGVDKIVYFNA